MAKSIEFQKYEEEDQLDPWEVAAVQQPKTIDQMDPWEVAALSAPQPETGPTGAEMLETAIRSGTEGLTAGISEPIISGGNALVDLAMDALLFNQEQDPNKRFDIENLKQRYAEDVARRRNLEAEMPIISTGSEIVGAINPLSAASAVGRGIVGLPKVAGAIGSAIKGAGEGVKYVEPALGAIGSAVKGVGSIPSALRGLETTSSLAGAVSKPLASGARAAAETLITEGTKQAVQSPSGFILPEDQMDSAGVQAGQAALFSGALALPGAAKQALKLGTIVGLNAPMNAVDDLWEAAKKGKVVIKSPDDIVEIADAAQKKIREATKGKVNEMTEKLVRSVDDIGAKATEFADQADQILASRPDIKIPKSVLLDSLNKQGKMFTFKGEILPGNRAGFEKLEEFKTFFNKLDDEIPATEARELLKQLRGDIIYDSSFSKTNEAIKNVAADLSDNIKGAIPEYDALISKSKAAMDDLVRAQKEGLDDPEKVYKKLSSILKDDIGASQLKQEAIQGIERYSNVKFQPLFQEISMMDKLGNQKITKGFLQSAVGADRSDQSKMLSQFSDLMKQLDLNDQEFDDFAKMASQSAKFEAFNRTADIGSKNVLAGIGLTAGLAGLDLAFGNILGLPTGVTVGIGTSIGLINSKFGPRMSKAIIERAARLEGTPTFQKIDKVFGDLPEDVRLQIKTSLAQGFTKATSEGPVPIPEEQIESIKQDIRNSKMNAFKKAEMLKKLQNEQALNGKDVGSLVVSDQEKPAPQRINKAEEEARLRLRKAQDAIRAKRIIDPKKAASQTEFVEGRKPEAY